MASIEIVLNINFEKAIFVEVPLSLYDRINHAKLLLISLCAKLIAAYFDLHGRRLTSGYVVSIATDLTCHAGYFLLISLT